MSEKAGEIHESGQRERAVSSKKSLAFGSKIMYTKHTGGELWGKCPYLW